jgi:hypothetical protein
MRPQYIIAFTIATFGYGCVKAQSMLPLIKATEKTVNIKDGTVFQKAIWTLSPDIRPDVYNVLESDAENKITFYTDIDSISFVVKPGESFDFLIVLNDTDTCYTQIRSIQKETIHAKQISAADLQHDFTLLRDALQREHAGLYRYISEDDFTHTSDSLLQALNQPIDQFKFGAIIRFYLASIKDGHTGSSLVGDLMQHYSQHVKMFPFQPLFIGNKAYAACSGLVELLPETELLSIDGMDLNDIRKQLFRYLSGDGRTESKKYWVLNRDAFPFLYSWVFGEKTEYTIEFKTKSGDVKTISLAAKHLKEPCTPLAIPHNTKELRLEYKSSKLAVLKIGTFSSEKLRQTNENFVQFLDTTFRELKANKTTTLIIDLRYNSGGDDTNGALLYSYLTSKQFKYFESIETTRKKLTTTEHPGLGIQEPAETNFNGKVIFIINGLCFSTTADFCAIAKSNNRGKFVGEETGGAYQGNTSGETFRMTLPNSNINISIPTHIYRNAVRKLEYSDRGIIPDYIVGPSINEVIAGKDVQLDYALKLFGR